MWLRTCKYFREKYEKSSPEDLLQRTYECESLYAKLKTSTAARTHISCVEHYEEGIISIFNRRNKRKEIQALHTLVPFISSSSSSSGVVGYTEDFASSTLREEIARTIGRQVDDLRKMHGTWIHYHDIHIPTIVFAESVYTILHGTCFPDRRRLPSRVGKDGRKGVDHTAYQQSIRKNPQERLEELQQLFDSGRRDETKILFVLHGIDGMVSPATVPLITTKYMYQIGVEDEECILRNILKWAFRPDSNLSVILLTGQDFTDQDMYRLLLSS